MNKTNKSKNKYFSHVIILPKILIYIAVLCFLFNSSGLLLASDLSTRLRELYSQQNNAKQEMQDKQSAAKEKKQEATNLSNSIENLQGNISETEKRINSLTGQISSTEKEINQTNTEIEDRQKELVIENQNKENTLVELYQTGRKNFWEIIISVNNLSEVINQNHYFEILESKLEASINRINQIKTDLENKKSELDKKKANLASLKGEQQAYKISLDSQKKEKEVVLKDTKVQQSKLEDQVEEAKRLTTQVESQIANIQAEIRRSSQGGGSVAPKDKGTSPVGLSWPANYRYISCYYGSSTPFQSFHTGIDLVNIQGTPIYSSADGTVVTVRDMMTDGRYYGYGKYVVIAHNSKYSTLYAHLMSYTVSPGQEVKRGDVIGYLGNTGWSTGPHLHFEVWENGNRVNPISYLP